ncbi:Bleomycin hydrolase [Liparis tanakae]|uniref:Bleomycin hydrolase n=1 Tax=Liparis tanakae TaxID=230148 RepID=A0A4Z2H4J2_9TELE|nr:Bleomycin hydrolase [Liparis tanakae]
MTRGGVGGVVVAAEQSAHTAYRLPSGRFVFHPTPKESLTGAFPYGSDRDRIRAAEVPTKGGRARGDSRSVERRPQCRAGSVNREGPPAFCPGYLIMTDDWFSEYVYEVVVDKKYLSDDVLAVMKEEPVVLPAWDPMGALA